MRLRHQGMAPGSALGLPSEEVPLITEALADSGRHLLAGVIGDYLYDRYARRHVDNWLESNLDAENLERARQLQDALDLARAARNPAKAINGARSVCAAKATNPTWPSTAQQMDDFLKIPGKRIPDTPSTPGRGKVEWRPNPDTKITFEQHPYHPNAPDWHKGPHFHLDTPGIKPHQRYLPGDPIPGY
jgi:hypothetical protein